MGRPATWLAVVAGYVGLFLGGAYVKWQFDQDHADMCRVVKNVHINAVFRYHTEQQQLMSSLDYVRDPKAQRKNPDLVQRVRDNLPNQRARLAAARDGARATRVPRSCKN